MAPYQKGFIVNFSGIPHQYIKYSREVGARVFAYKTVPGDLEGSQSQVIEEGEPDFFIGTNKDIPVSIRVIKTDRYPANFRRGPFSIEQIAEIEAELEAYDIGDWPVESIDLNPPKTPTLSAILEDGDKFGPSSSSANTAPKASLKDIVAPSFIEGSDSFDLLFYEREVKNFINLTESFDIPIVLAINKLKNNIKHTSKDQAPLLKHVSRDNPQTVGDYIDSVRNYVSPNSPLRALELFEELVSYRGSRENLQNTIEAFEEKLSRFKLEPNAGPDLIEGLLLVRSCEFDSTDLSILASNLPKINGKIDFSHASVKATLKSGVLSSSSSATKAAVDLYQTTHKGNGKKVWKPKCRFGSSCSKKGCEFYHPAKPQSAQTKGKAKQKGKGKQKGDGKPKITA